MAHDRNLNPLSKERKLQHGDQASCLYFDDLKILFEMVEASLAAGAVFGEDGEIYAAVEGVRLTLDIA
jgi:hypothetical protein